MNHSGLICAFNVNCWHSPDWVIYYWVIVSVFEVRYWVREWCRREPVQTGSNYDSRIIVILQPGACGQCSQSQADIVFPLSSFTGCYCWGIWCTDAETFTPLAVWTSKTFNLPDWILIIHLVRTFYFKYFVILFSTSNVKLSQIFIFLLV